MQLLMGISINRYLAARGTAGFARSLVSGYSRVPAPPPRIIANTLFKGTSVLPGSGSRALPAGYGPFEIFMKDGLSESELAISKLLVRLACSFFLATVE